MQMQNFPCPNCGRCDYRWLGHVLIDGMQCCEHCEAGGIQMFESGLEAERIAANKLSSEIERLEALRPPSNKSTEEDWLRDAPARWTVRMREDQTLHDFVSKRVADALRQGYMAAADQAEMWGGDKEQDFAAYLDTLKSASPTPQQEKP